MTEKEKGILNYILENCIFAYDELYKVNNELIEGMKPDSGANVNHLGALNRMIQDYLIVRVAGLFDKTRGVISFEKLILNNDDFDNIKEQEITKYIIEKRNNFVAHVNKNDFVFPITDKICSSNLKELLKNLQELLKD